MAAGNGHFRLLGHFFSPGGRATTDLTSLLSFESFESLVGSDCGVGGRVIGVCGVVGTEGV